MDNNYFFVDGSSLIADIKRLRNSNKDLKSKKPSIKKFVKYFVGYDFKHLHGGVYKRFTFYFVNKDERIKDFFVLPNVTSPGVMEDTQIKYCGKRVPGSKRADKWIEETEIPKYVLERLKKSEKAVDTQICCDALSLACHNKLDRLFLYTNDYDYLPLCEALKTNGSNISLFRLVKTGVNKDLVENCDTFCVVDSTHLNPLFM